MKHLQVHENCDSKYPITWVAANITHCRINREYKSHWSDEDDALVSKSISVEIPGADGLLAEYAASERGWLYVSDWRANDLPLIPIEDGIIEVESLVGLDA